MLSRLRVKGLWSLAEVEVDFTPLSVVLGANGAGKSSLLNVFRLVRAMVGRGLAAFVEEMGGAASVLHYGPKVTRHAEIELVFDGAKGMNGYSATLVYVAPDRLVFSEERVSYQRPTGGGLIEHVIGPGAHAESYLSLLLDHLEPATPVARSVKWHLDRFCHYHFHDTSNTAALRRTGDVDDTAYLRPDGGNLAAFLLALRGRAPEAYERIRATVGRVFPRFDDFVLEPVGAPRERVMLRWRERGSAYDFGPHHLSDGTLRFIAYATLLLQPGAPRDTQSPNYPQLIVVDEPELGLHPAALALLGELLRAAPTQRIVATQSLEMMNILIAEPGELANLLLVDRDDAGSILRRPDLEALRPWLDEFDPAQMWTHGILGALP